MALHIGGAANGVSGPRGREGASGLGLAMSTASFPLKTNPLIHFYVEHLSGLDFNHPEAKIEPHTKFAAGNLAGGGSGDVAVLLPGDGCKAVTSGR